MKNQLILFSFLIVHSLIYSQHKVSYPLAQLAEKVKSINDTCWNKYNDEGAKCTSNDSISFMNLDRKLDSLVVSVEYINLLNKYNLGRYFLQIGDKNKAAEYFKLIQKFYFLSISDKHRFTEYSRDSYYDGFFELYWRSGQYLIEVLEGNLKELEKLDFWPSTGNILYWRLKSAIEKAGGVWTRGGVNYPSDLPELLKHRQLNNKK